MIKVMIVDDELPIREWLLFVIDQIKEDIQVVACAANGEEAYEQFCRHLPDIVITDIKMPKMDGMELLRMIREYSDDTYVVILTSYHDFEYARTALKYNANDFILKNEISQESIKEVIIKFQLFRNNEPSIVVNKKVVDVLKDPDLLREFFVDDGQKNIVIFYANKRREKEMFNLNVEKGIIEVQEYDYDAEKKLLLLKMDLSYTTSHIYNKAREVAERISSILNTSVGVSGLEDDVVMAIERARCSWNLTFYSNDNIVINYSNESEEIEEQLKSQRNQVIEDAYKNTGNLEKQIENIIYMAEEGKYSDIDKLKNFIIDILNVHKLSHSKYQSKEYENNCNQIIIGIKEAFNKSELKEYITKYLELEEEINIPENYSQYMSLVRKYVKDHYQTIESISEVADYLHLHKDYFCRMFKEKEGETFTSYLTNYRIEKAKDLLLKTNMKVNEVAEAVGYSSLSYFSRVFKKKTKKNPFEYRSQ